MDIKTFDTIVDDQMLACMSVLALKANEYATDDRLHNFKTAAILQDILPREALAGMMAKHTISIYDMCGSDQAYPDEIWNEKITDHINYLILLKAIIQEEKKEEKSDTPEQLPLWQNPLETALTSLREQKWNEMLEIIREREN